MKIWFFLVLATHWATQVAVAVEPSKREKQMEFESGLVEGVSTDPGSGSLTSKDRAGEKPHLYKRDRLFDSEKNRTIQEIRYQ
jgi:hypothetical protein